MTSSPLASNSILHSNRTRMGLFMCLAVFLALILPGMALATTDDGGTTTVACGFLGNVSSVLNAISIVVVTIAIIFTGYKVAFAHARISEVAPVLIGAVLIGAASQIANLFLKSSASSNGAQACTTTGIVNHIMDHYATVAHLLHNYA